MNNYYFKKDKVIELFNIIQKEIKLNKRNLENAFNLDFEEWETKIEFEKVLEIFDNIKEKEYLPKFAKDQIVDGFGKVILICNQNPYLILNFILSCIYTNNKTTVILERKMLATNKAIIEIIRKYIIKLKLDLDTVEYIEVDNKDKVVEIQDNYDLLYYFGNKQEYINFTKRLHIDSKFENFGEIYVYMDSKDFKSEFINIDKFAYLNEINVEYYSMDFENSINQINNFNNVNKISVIFTKNIDKAYQFIRKIKSENVYINKDPCQSFKYETNMNNLVYIKNIKK